MGRLVDKRALFLSLAIIDLCFSYLLFTNQQYFSATAMSLVFALAFIAALLFIAGYACNAKEKGINALLAASSVISIFIILYEIGFILLPQSLFYFALHVLLIAGSAALVSAFFVYLAGRLLRNVKGSSRIALLAMLLGITSVIAYLIMYGTAHVAWNGVDELAYNYYAAKLFVNGTNPYSVSMEPILNGRHISPTVLLNGTYEYAYSYPAFSFLAFAFIPLLGVTSFFSFILILILMAIVAAYWSYSASGFRPASLLPIGVWLLATYTLVGVASQYLAISIFFFLAYMQRKRAWLSGTLAGIAASTTQLAWFAIPFLYVLMLKEHGRSHLLRSAAYSLAAFLVINAYFFISYPKAIFNVFGLFSLNKLVFYGADIMQFFAAFYPVPLWYPAFVSLSLLAAALLAFYRYKDKLLVVLAVAPSMIFFVSWRNISVYALPFIPLMITIYYEGAPRRKARRLKNAARFQLYAVLALFLIFVVVGIYGHAVYTSKKLLQINRIVPVVSIGGNYGSFALEGLEVNVTNNNHENETLSFLIESRSPSNEGYVLGSTQKSLTPGETYNYVTAYQLPLIDNKTRLFITAFSSDYYATNTFDISLSPPQSFPT